MLPLPALRPTRHDSLAYCLVVTSRPEEDIDNPYHALRNGYGRPFEALAYTLIHSQDSLERFRKEVLKWCSTPASGNSPWWQEYLR